MNLDITYMNMSMNMNMNQGRKEGRKEWGGVFRGWHDIFPSPESPDEVFQPNVCELRFSHRHEVQTHPEQIGWT